MREVSPPILTPLLYCLVVFAISSVVLTVMLVLISHSMLGEMRPMNGFFVIGVATFAGLVALLVAGRYVARIARRIRS